ncbi:MAG: hypothetical protein WC748_05015 [Legionellales bacterium]
MNPAGIEQLMIQHTDRWNRLNGNINLISEVENFIKNNIRLFKKEYVPYVHTTNFCLSAFTFGTPGVVVSSNIAALYEINEFVDTIVVDHRRLIG